MANPEALESEDDRGMTPIDLAYRMTGEKGDDDRWGQAVRELLSGIGGERGMTSASTSFTTAHMLKTRGGGEAVMDMVMPGRYSV